MSVRRIAEKANVSIATVSRVMKDGGGVAPETRERVLRVAQQMGYADVARPAEPCIGLGFAGINWFSEYERMLVHGLREVLGDQRLDLRLIDIERDKQPQESYTEFFVRKGLRGVVLRVTERARQVAFDTAAEGFPHVVVADEFDESDVNYVVCDSQHESQQAVEHLIDLGHRRIAFGMHILEDRDHLNRLRAYEQAHRRLGIEVDQRLIVRIETKIASGTAIFNRVMSLQDPPTAIVLADPELTIGVMRRAAEVGLAIPSELSVVGFDDGDMRHMFCPRVTAVCQDTPRLGSAAASVIIDIMSGQVSAPVHRVLPATFEVNSSTGLAPAIAVRILPTGNRAQRAEVVSATPQVDAVVQDRV